MSVSSTTQLSARSTEFGTCGSPAWNHLALTPPCSPFTSLTSLPRCSLARRMFPDLLYQRAPTSPTTLCFVSLYFKCSTDIRVTQHSPKQRTCSSIKVCLPSPPPQIMLHGVGDHLQGGTWRLKQHLADSRQAVSICCWKTKW